MDIKTLITNKFPVQYVYSYPTTRSYQINQEFQLRDAVFTQNINVYIHIPFCNQKCIFCGYLTVIEQHEENREAYVDALVQEILTFKPYANGKVVTTVNFGGGTPSLLSLGQIDKIMNALQATFPGFKETTTELSMEATPESVNDSLLQHLRNHGFNRISIGIQTLDDGEIVQVKRHNLSSDSVRAMELVRKAGIDNLCVDLMYGLPGQTTDSWQETVKQVTSFLPETIELYRTVVIPRTRLARSVNPSQSMQWQQKYEWYNHAREVVKSLGYVYDSHVRFVIPNKGFYHQQHNVFQGQSLVGFGVGARSYAENAHYRNTYSGAQSKTAIKKYIEACTQGRSVIESVKVLSREEQARRYIIYNLECLDGTYLLETFSFNFFKVYKSLIAQLCALGVAIVINNYFLITRKGAYHRDLIAYLLFSKESMDLEKAYYGTFLKDW